MFFKKTLEILEETLFPLFCIGCDKEGDWVCSKCMFDFDTNGIFWCPVCKENSTFGKTCDKCRKKSHLDSVVSVFNFKKNPNINKIIELWKYQYAEELSEVLNNFIQDFSQSNFFLLNSFEAIVPVPLHPRRLAERGFNQSEIIAKSLGEVLDIPFLDLLQRKRYTKQQAKLKKKERNANVQNAFSLNKKFVVPKSVILIDDVYTTGSTMQECAKILKAGEVKQVAGFVIVRG